ncbi:MAG TPA: penicillin-binding protein 1C [Chthoniobacterales bacterium]|nr:penicillin-binding protein 1C [Chthoniobacterales bacterium]
MADTGFRKVKTGARRKPRNGDFQIAERIKTAVWKPPLLGWLRRLVYVSMTLAAIWLALPKPPLLEGIDFSTRVRGRNGEVLRVTLTSDHKYRIWTPLREIPPALVSATLQFEDKYYGKHPGVNPASLARAAWNLAFSTGTRAGASTITMQVARLRYRLHTRTIAGKLRQIVYALELERHYTKAQILEAYLNLAPYGRNIEGVGAASELYFSKSASRVTSAEAVALSIIPQSPTRRALVARGENERVTRAQARWYSRANAEETPSLTFRAEARARRHLLAPHFVQQVLESRTSNREITTTLDLPLQQMLEKRMADYVAQNRERGIENASALLIDFTTMEVLAKIGSSDFSSEQIQGQVDGTRSRRSPGSTLKPFVYALALDQGRIHPLTLLKDAPRAFGDYNPENFDRDFLGPIRASDALARSRNVPAVTLASELSHPTFYEFLRQADVALPKPPSFYGLSLPLGGAEVTMEDLVRLYAALANGGRLQPLRRFVTDPPAPYAPRIVSAEAAFLTLDMLGQIPRPGLTQTDSIRSAPVFWKTGTSHGFRDAWSVAVFDHYVLAVWAGNFNGKRNGALIGRTAAAPLLFQMIDGVRWVHPSPSKTHEPDPGLNLKRVEFCSVSGQLPGSSCSHRTESWFVPGISPISNCDVHREVLVDASTGLRVPQDDGTRELRREVYEFWSSDLLALFERAGVPRKLPPPFLPTSESEFLARGGHPPKIRLPAAEMAISQSSSNGSIPLRAETETGVRKLYWFADKTFLGACDPKEVLAWKPSPGVYQLTALDDHGRSASRSVILR